MTRGLLSFIAALAMGVSPIAAQTCDMEKASQLVDGYASQPFSARTWRVLEGLGDPQVEEGSGDNRWDAENRFREIARKAAPNVSVPDSIGYECRVSYPLEVMEQRIKALGDTHPYVEQWVRAQLAIFAACGGDKTAELPPALSADGVTAQLQQQDRDYQQAALAFYKDRNASRAMFSAIGASQSPHRAAARYMVANIDANAKRVADARDEAKAILADPSLSSVHEITQELLGYIANIEDTAAGWSELLDNTIQSIETPAAAIMVSDKAKADYRRALYDIDFAGIRAKQDDWWMDGKLPENPTISKALVDASRKHAIVPWMIAGQTAQEYYAAGGWSLIGAKWDERTGTLIDRALALTANTPPLARDTLSALKAKPDDATVQALVAAARAATDKAAASCGNAAESAAAGTLTLHAVRVAAMAGRYDDAYALIEAYPFKTANSFRAGTVLELGRYLLAEGRLDEARRFRDRILTPAFFSALDGSENESLRGQFAGYLQWIAEDRAHWLSALALHPRRTELAILNFLPAKDLRAMAKDDKTFSEAERALLVRAAWTRVYALGKKPEQALTDELYALNPALQDIAVKAKADYPKTGESYLRLLSVLRTPRYNTLVNAPGQWEPLAMTDLGESAGTLDEYDHNDRNWWCPFEPDRHLGALRAEFDMDSGSSVNEWMQDEMKAVADPAIKANLDQLREMTLGQHPVVKTIGWKELAALSAAPGAPKRLAERAMAWAKASRGKDGAPEALALAVRATRYGCNWHGGHKAYSKPAQEMLQAKFKDTVWASQTPYWFDCMNQKWSTNPDDYTKVATCDVQAWPKQAPLK